MTFDEIRNLASGFQSAQLLLTALDLGVFDLLSTGKRDAPGIAAALKLDGRATEIAANGLVALEFLEVVAGRYSNAESTERLLVRGSPDYRGEILRHIHASWEDWGALAATWRTGAPAMRRKSKQLPSSPEGLQNFILGMENVTRELAPLLAERLPLEECRKVLDLGGGPGNYALSFVRRWSQLSVVHFDLAPTSQIAQEFLRRKEGAERVSFLEGDFLNDSLGDGYDFIWMSQVAHMLSEAQVRLLFRRSASAMAEGGLLAVHDQFLEPSKTSPRQAALFGVHMLAVTEGGRTYSLEELEEWLISEGLFPTKKIDYGGPSRILISQKRTL